MSVDLDQDLRLALTEDNLDVSQIFTRVRREMRPRRSGAALIAIAAGLLLVAIVVPGLIEANGRRTTIATAAVCDHYKELERPSTKKWFTLPADVDRYVSQRFPEGRELVAALTPPGASFEKVGTCRLEGVRYAHFVYRLGAGDISVFVRLREPVERATPRFDYRDDEFGLQVAAFNTRRYTGLVVSTLAVSATRGISDSIAGQLER